MSVDLGTGDGRLPYVSAGQDPDRLFVGIDASAAGLRELSNRAARAGLANLLYVRAAVEALPPELIGVADRVTVILPWGSLLAAVAAPRVPLLRQVRALCQPAATLAVVLGIDPVRDQAEARRLGLPSLTDDHLRGPLVEGYAAAGFRVRSLRPLSADQLRRWPSSWAGRLAQGRDRAVFEIEGRACP